MWNANACLTLSCLWFCAATAGAETAPSKRAPVTDRAHLGVELQPAFGAQGDEAVRINYVFPESTAQAMGLRTGDQLIGVNGKPMQGRRTLLDEPAKMAIGDPLELKVLRGGETLTLRGALRSYEKTRRAFLEMCRKELSAKPLSPSCPIEWIQGGADGLKALQGKLGVVVFFDGCQECVGRKWMKVVAMEEKFQKIKGGLDWIGFAGIYSNVNQTHAANLETANKVLSRFPSNVPVGVARYPGDVVPPDSAPRDALIHDHGIALLDPQGNVLFLDLVSPDLDAPGGEFQKAFVDAWGRFGPKKEAEKATPPPPASQP